MKTTNNIAKEPTVAYGNSVQQMKAQIVEAVNATNNAKILEKLLLIIKKQKVSKCGMDEAIEDIPINVEKNANGSVNVYCNDFEIIAGPDAVGKFVLNQGDTCAETFVLRNEDHLFTKEYKEFLKDYYLD